MMELFTEAIDHQECIVDTKAKAHTGNQIQSKDTDACDEGDEIDNCKRADDRTQPNNEWSNACDQPTEDEEKQDKDQGD